MAIQLIAFDLDGTVIGRDGVSVSKDTLEAFQLAHEKGVHIVPNTGRTLCVIPDSLMAADFIRYVIISNGAAVYDKQRQAFIYRQYIPYKDILWILEQAKPMGLFTEVYTGGKCFVEKGVAPAYGIPDAEEGLAFLLDRVQFVDCYRDVIHEDVEKASFLHINETQRKALLALIEKKGLHGTASAADNIEINNLQANKGIALQYLCRKLQIDKQNVMAFGDGMNDIEMLGWADYSFAMANACPQAKAVARYETSSNENEGVTRMIKKYLLNL